MSERDENILEEKVFNVPLTKAWTFPIKERTPKALHVLKAFIRKHMKTETIAISSEVNELFWGRGIEGTPRHLRVRAAKGKDDKVTVHLVEESKDSA